MLAVVYETFTRIEREKFKKLLLHKRKACQHAFRLLVTKQDPHKIGFKQFKGLMRYYAPKKSQYKMSLEFRPVYQVKRVKPEVKCISLLQVHWT